MGEPEEIAATHRATYDAAAARYAVVNAQMPVAVQASARRLLETVGTPALILELGCGHGRDAAWFEAHGADVVAADLSAGMLAETRLRVAGPVVQVDMRGPAFRGTVFDGVWSNAAMLHLQKTSVPGALAEVRRILKPGGVFFVSIQVGAGETWEAVSYGRPGARLFSRYAPAEFGALIEVAGMQLLEVEESFGGPRRHWAHYLARRV
ncbi:MAG: class I SAM-dependent methyltransferase [Anaerolineae bacterium]|nr:class I SAM-dependent methyltransferase [Anaerolineae bacterium]